jgi:hypothetical protein
MAIKSENLTLTNDLYCFNLRDMKYHDLSKWDNWGGRHYLDQKRVDLPIRWLMQKNGIKWI